MIKPMPANMMESFHSDFRPENIATTVSTAFRHDGEVGKLDEKYSEGGQCRIYKVNFSDESWSVRIPHVQSSFDGAIKTSVGHQIISFVERERDVIQEVGKSGFPWAPTLLGLSLTFENGIGRPFILLSWIEGSHLQWTELDPPRPVRDKILRQVAQIHMNLLECTQEMSMFKPFCFNYTLT